MFGARLDNGDVVLYDEEGEVIRLHTGSGDFTLCNKYMPPWYIAMFLEIMDYDENLAKNLVKYIRKRKLSERTIKKYLIKIYKEIEISRKVVLFFSEKDYNIFFTSSAMKNSLGISIHLKSMPLYYVTIDYKWIIPRDVDMCKNIPGTRYSGFRRLCKQVSPSVCGDYATLHATRCLLDIMSRSVELAKKIFDVKRELGLRKIDDLVISTYKALVEKGEEEAVNTLREIAKKKYEQKIKNLWVYLVLRNSESITPEYIRMIENSRHFEVELATDFEVIRFGDLVFVKKFCFSLHTWVIVIHHVKKEAVGVFLDEAWSLAVANKFTKMVKQVLMGETIIDKTIYLHDYDKQVAEALYSTALKLKHIAPSVRKKIHDLGYEAVKKALALFIADVI